MNILLFEDRDRLDNGLVSIRDERLQHLRNVLGSQDGDSIRVGEVDGQLGNARVVEISASQALLAPELTQAPPPKLDLTLVLALPRPKMLRRILRTVAELGVPRLHLINSYRVEKSYWKSPALAADKVRGYFLDGLQQARDTVLPSCELHTRFKPFVEDQLGSLMADRSAYIAHPNTGAPCPVSLAGPVLLVIGPEGGFIPFEVDLLQQQGGAAVHLGPRILRVETAVTSLLARVSA